MEKNIRELLDDAFSELPQTKKVIDLKDELYANMCDKYQDQKKLGKSSEEAYEAVVAGMGDLGELVASVQDPYPLAPDLPAAKKKRATLTAVAVMLYILSPMALIMGDELLGDSDELGLLGMFVMIAVASGLLVYVNMIKPHYQKADDTLVEDFKLWRVSTERKNYAYKTFMSAYWSIVVALYLLVSFMTFAWGWTWLILVVAGAIENVIKGVILLRETDDAKKHA